MSEDDRFNQWIKTQKVVIREVSTDGGQAWMMVAVPQADLARASWQESARQTAAQITEQDRKARV